MLTKLRQEMPNGQISIIDSHAGKSLMLHPADKCTTLVNMAVMPAQQATNYFDILRTGLHSAEDDPAVDRESLGKKHVDGREVIGYRVNLTASNTELTIWGDPETGMPIVAEMKLGMLPAATVTLTDFEFDVALSEDLFDTNVPNGYSVTERHCFSTDRSGLARRPEDRGRTEWRRLPRRL